MHTCIHHARVYAYTHAYTRTRRHAWTHQYGHRPIYTFKASIKYVRSKCTRFGPTAKLPHPYNTCTRLVRPPLTPHSERTYFMDAPYVHTCAHVYARVRTCTHVYAGVRRCTQVCASVHTCTNIRIYGSGIYVHRHRCIYALVQHLQQKILVGLNYQYFDHNSLGKIKNDAKLTYFIFVKEV